MRILIIDNYDSFTFNLLHYVEQFVDEVVVIRNDEAYNSELELCDKVIFSPGPGLPKESGMLMEILDRAVRQKPVLGVCLGHQAIGEYFGASLRNLDQVHHGQSSQLEIIKGDDPLFQNISRSSTIGHYHSWVIDRNTLPNSLEITSTSLQGEIMSVKHKNLPIWGVQFHPESILTSDGLQMLENWIKA